MRLRFGPLWVAVLLVLAGCTGTPATETATTATPGNETTTSAASSSTHDATTTASPASSTTRATRATLDAEDLYPSERELLRRAVENGSVTVARSNLSGRLTPETDGWDVLYRGTRYELSWQYEGFRGEYALAGATEADASAVESGDGVVTYENLSTDARELFDVARSGNSTDSYGAKAFPDQLQDNRYVTYEGEYYRLHLQVGDYEMYRLSVSEVDD